MKISIKLIAAISAFATLGSGQAALVISNYSTTTLTFDATVPNVWGGTSGVSGSIFATTATNANPLDSDSFAGTVNSALATTIPAAATGTAIAVGYGGVNLAGAIARGVDADKVATSGAYVAKTTAGAINGNALAWRAGGAATQYMSWFLLVQNTTGSTVSQWNIGYKGYYLNNDSIASTGGLRYATSSDATNFSVFSTTIAGSTFISPGTNTTPTPSQTDWVSAKTFSSVVDISVANNEYFVLVIDAYAASGGNSNSLAFDDVSIAAIPEPSTWALLTGAGVFFLMVARRRRMATR